MATVSIDIPNGSLSRVTTAYASVYGYQAIINGSPNPQTIGEFTRQQIIRQVKDIVKQFEGPPAISAAATTLDTNVNSIAIT